MVAKRFFTGLALALALGASAAAHDYIVVASSDPAVAPGQGFDAGARVPLAAGRTATLMYASGDLVALKGAAGGVVLPARRANSAEAQRLDVLRMMVGPAPTGQAVTARHRGVCPALEALTTLDDIAQVYQAGCAELGRTALAAWIEAHPPV